MSKDLLCPKETWLRGKEVTIHLTPHLTIASPHTKVWSDVCSSCHLLVESFCWNLGRIWSFPHFFCLFMTNKMKAVSFKLIHRFYLVKNTHCLWDLSRDLLPFILVLYFHGKTLFILFLTKSCQTLYFSTKQILYGVLTLARRTQKLFTSSTWLYSLPNYTSINDKNITICNACNVFV